MLYMLTGLSCAARNSWTSPHKGHIRGSWKVIAVFSYIVWWNQGFFHMQIEICKFEFLKINMMTVLNFSAILLCPAARALLCLEFVCMSSQKHYTNISENWNKIKQIHEVFVCCSWHGLWSNWLTASPGEFNGWQSILSVLTGLSCAARYSGTPHQGHIMWSRKVIKVLVDRILQSSCHSIIFY